MDDIHNFGFDLVRATEQTALRAGRWVGLGDRAKADEVGTAAMMAMLDMAPMTGYLLDSEARKAGYHAQQDSRKRVGAGGPAMDLVVDAIDGVGLLAQGRPGAIAVACAAPRGTIWSPAPAIYMEKIVVDREVGAALVAECMDAPAAWTLALVARLKRKAVRDLVVFVLDRPRHSNLIDDIRRAGARAQVHHDGDVAGALMAAMPGSGIDVLMGIGGALEGVIAAAAVRALGGAMLARLAPQNDEERAALQDAHQDVKRVYNAADMVAGDEIFFAATGITDGMLLEGVAYQGNRATTHSLVIRGKSGVRRLIQTDHPLMEGGRHRERLLKEGLDTEFLLRNSVSLRLATCHSTCDPLYSISRAPAAATRPRFLPATPRPRSPETRGHPAAAYPAGSPWRPC